MTLILNLKRSNIMTNPNQKQNQDDVNVSKQTINRNEQPSLVGTTFIKYAAYIIILVIVLYFTANYILPMFQ